MCRGKKVCRHPSRKGTGAGLLAEWYNRWARTVFTVLWVTVPEQTVSPRIKSDYYDFVCFTWSVALTGGYLLDPRTIMTRKRDKKDVSLGTHAFWGFYLLVNIRLQIYGIDCDFEILDCPAITFSLCITVRNSQIFEAELFENFTTMHCHYTAGRS